MGSAHTNRSPADLQGKIYLLERNFSRGLVSSGEGTSRRGYPTPEQQLVEADKRCRRKLATLARDHIMKLREERHRISSRMAGGVFYEGSCS